jgi:GntR family transcriptional regulator
VPAEGDACKVLKVVQGAPLLSVDRLTFTYGDRPVEVRRGLYSTRQHFYKNELS